MVYKEEHNQGENVAQLAKQKAIEILQSLKPTKDVPSQDELDRMIDNERRSLSYNHNV
ncbi:MULTISPECIES: hypothetical protein [Pasteurellaceae]|uniref:hypothetical protein n=1 Tax=Pasteurellaceae TaxID=712 RepID=UPI0013019468|nr:MULTISPECIES: hypothetical protein [Pasteurellaceae]MDO4626786.1 hypothetical protein [Pasteurellaceae bacterium]MEB3468091.1 hypothetical protein [Pasteurella multocida]MEB3498176.1 hypothetical protein [Pasteurella multocida]HDR1814892.1 hypothetical protein [Pasteurella multocida]HDR1908240.1 hypothetical protein [Pasteurella multocida]